MTYLEVYKHSNGLAAVREDGKLDRYWASKDSGGKYNESEQLLLSVEMSQARRTLSWVGQAYWRR
jgi:hypothetical protein